MIDLEKERATVHSSVNALFDIVSVQQSEINLMNIDVSNKQSEITELKQKLARYENPDYVLVPRELTESMRKEGREQIEYGKLCADAVYKAMIEAVEKDDE